MAAGQANQARNLDELLQGLKDREAIRELAVLYCHNVWLSSNTGIVDLFTDDAVFDLLDVKPSGEVVLRERAVGRAHLLDFYKRGIEGIHPRPFAHNVLVELTGKESGTGWVVHEVRSAKDGWKGYVAGTYEDQYVKVGGVWKFKYRRNVLYHLNQA